MMRRGLTLAVCVLISLACHDVSGQASNPARAKIAQPTADQREEAKLRARLQAIPHDVEAARNLACLLEQSGRPNAALGLRRSILTNNDDPAKVPALQLELATSLVELGRSREAIPVLQRIVSEDPKNQAAMFELGTALARTEDFSAAIDAFIKAVQLKPSDRDAQLSTAKAMVTLLRYSEAKPYLEAAAQAGARTAEISTLRGIIYSHTARNKEAVNEFRAALEQDASNAETQLLLGESLLVEREPKMAILPLERAAAQRPSVAVYFQLAKAYRGAGDLEGEQKAVVLLHTMQDEQATQSKIDALKNAAEHAIAEKHYSEAVKSYEAASVLRPGDSDLLYREALATGQAGDRQEELRQLYEVLKQSPDSPGALSEAGILEGLRGESGRAKQHLRQALRLNPERADSLTNLAILLAKDGDSRSAEEMLISAIESDPAYASAYRSLGLIYAAEGRLREAEGVLKRGIAIDRDDTANHIALANVYLSEQQPSDAVIEFRAAALLEPNTFAIHLALAQTLRGQGRMDDALEEVRLALMISPSQLEVLALQKSLCEDVKGTSPHPRGCQRLKSPL